jgi:A/G-specific adenine glycosylase
VAPSGGARRAALPDEARRLSAIRRALLRHYDQHRRELPWRGTADPYRVWVSEIMLQQTRADVVAPYYERWLERFPTLDALADAELDDVLHAWQGLGYYARARNLHRAARMVRERHGGELPRDAAALRALPGVGAYTAGAIASIAFGEPCPAVDGNVRRVLARLFDLADAAPGTIHELAARLVPRRRAGDFNQALMDLGATVCSPRRQACGECPLARWCLARARGTQAERPARRRRPQVPAYDVGTAVLRARDGRLLLVRRPEDGLLGGMWSFPGEVARAGESVEDAAARAGRAASGLAIVGRGRPLGSVVHVFSHRREVYHVFLFVVPDAGTEGVAPRRERVVPCCEPVVPRHGRAVRGDRGGRRVTRGRGAHGLWVAPEELERYALPAAQRRILRMVEER